MIKTAKKGEVPGVETYYEIPPQKTGHDYKPTEKDIKTEWAAENMENFPGVERLAKESSDVVPQSRPLKDILKQLAMRTEHEVGGERFSMSLPSFDKRYGRRVIGETFYKDGMDSVEFIIRDSETGEILESKNIKFMHELPEELVEGIEKWMREGYPGEKSH